MIDLLKQAEDAFTQKDYPRAEAIYRDILKHNPHHEAAFQAWAEMALSLNNPKVSLKLSEVYLKENKDHKAALLIKARAHEALKEREDAAQTYSRILSLFPQDSEIQFYYGLFCVRTENWQSAVSLLSKAKAHFKDNPLFKGHYQAALKNAVSEIHKAEKPEQTQRLLDLALAEMPKDADLLFIQGQNHILKDDPILAIECLKASLAQNPNHRLAQYHLGYVLDKIGWSHEAVHHLHKAVTGPRTKDRFILTLLECHIKLEQYSEALKWVELLESILTGARKEALNEYKARLYDLLNEKEKLTQTLDHLKTVSPRAAINFEKLDPDRRYDDPTLELMFKSELEAQGFERQRAFNITAIGQFFHRNKNYTRAMDCYNAAHSLMKPESPQRLTSEIDAYKLIFKEEEIKRIQSFGSKDDSPIFIVGLPRSGTSLLETMLGRHSDISTAGELTFMIHAPRFIEGYPKLECITPENSRRLSEGYLGRLEVHRHGKKQITDKMPMNFKQLGLIALLFPKAKVLFTKRQPISNCLSIYQQMFSGYHPFAHDLTNLADFYADHLELMEFWKSLFGEQIFTVEYERLVSDPQKSMEEILTFLGKDWQDSVLKQDKNATVRTASSWQIRKDIYTDAIESWKKYEPYLGELKEALKGHGLF